MTQAKDKQRLECQHWRLVLTTLLVAVSMLTATAQNQTVTGTVTSAADGETLIGATVMVKGTNTGTVTDFDGQYSVKIAKGQTLVLKISVTSKAVGSSLFPAPILQIIGVPACFA